MPPNLLKKKNKDYLTAFELFTKEHEELTESGEKWMKSLSKSYMIVSTLIATVVFATAFTVPGGNDNENGLPIFLWTNSFFLFAGSSALALFSSLTSLLMFLSILTARYASEDFLRPLPKRLIMGMGFLFLAFVLMITAFGAALSIVLSKRLEWVSIPIILSASLSASVIILLQVPFFSYLVKSTYWPIV